MITVGFLASVISVSTAEQIGRQATPDDIHLVVDDGLLNKTLAVVGRGRIVTDDQLDPLAGDRVAVLLIYKRAPATTC